LDAREEILLEDFKVAEKGGTRTLDHRRQRSSWPGGSLGTRGRVSDVFCCAPRRRPALAVKCEPGLSLGQTARAVVNGGKAEEGIGRGGGGACGFGGAAAVVRRRKIVSPKPKLGQDGSPATASRGEALITFFAGGRKVRLRDGLRQAARPRYS